MSYIVENTSTPTVILAAHWIVARRYSIWLGWRWQLVSR